MAVSSLSEGSLAVAVTVPAAVYCSSCLVRMVAKKGIFAFAFFVFFFMVIYLGLKNIAPLLPAVQVVPAHQ